MEQGATRRAALRRRQVIAAGHAGGIERARRSLDDPDPVIRAAAVGALARSDGLNVSDIAHALGDESNQVRRRATHAAVAVRGKGSKSELFTLLVTALADPDPIVAVNAAWFLAERRVRSAVGPLATMAGDHVDVRCREAAVAALGAIGDPLGLPVVVHALNDKATVRRRATVALAGFDHPDVEPALRRAAEDRDWQVRQAAEELLSTEGSDISHPQ